MASNNGVLLRILFNRYHRLPPASVLQILPESLSKSVQTHNIVINDPAPALTSPLEQIANIHYSWLISPLKELPESLQAPTLSALSAEQSKKLQKLLAQPKIEKISSPVLKTFLINKLFEKVKPKGILPIAHMQEGPLSFLLHMNKTQLVEVIDLLGIHDLAESIRSIIDKKFLQKVYACLNPKQTQFLRKCLMQQEKMVSSKIELSSWDGSCKSLNYMLQQRGLLRLGKIVCGQSADMMWHLTHTLDTGRGNILLSYYKPTPDPKFTARLVQQLTNLMNFLNQKGAK